MAFNLTVSAITPPAGLPHANRKAEIMELPSYLRVTGASGSSELKLIFVSTTAPGADNIDNVWLKPDEALTPEGVSAHGLYLYDTTHGVWLLMGGPGVESGTTAPTDLNVLWLKTDGEDAILTPDGTAVTAPQGLYKYDSDSGAWTCFTTTTIPAGSLEIISQATAPANADIPFWLKTTDATTPRGLHYWDGAWVNGTLPPAATAIVNGTTLATGSGVGANYIYTRSSQPPAAIRNFVLWAKTGNAPNGLFWPDSANSRWESITPILISRLYPPATNTNIPAGVTNLAGLSYDNICATIGTAVFASAPMVTVMLEYDDLFPTAYLSWGVTPLTSTFSIACSNPDYWDGVSAWVNSARNIQFRLSAVGIIWIPFV